MNTTTLLLIFVAINVVLIALFILAYQLFRSDPAPTVSDPLGVPRVARVSGVIGTLAETRPIDGDAPAVAAMAAAPGSTNAGSGASATTATVSKPATSAPSSQKNAVKQSKAAPSENTVPPGNAGLSRNKERGTTSEPMPHRDEERIPIPRLDLPGLFAVDTGAVADG